MNPNDEVLHPQWGRGTVLFDKPHCVAVRFLEHGQVNFSQEEWAEQHSPPERFRGILSKGGTGISDLEYALEAAVYNGDLTEAQALVLYDRRVHILEVNKQRSPSLDEAYEAFLKHPKDVEMENAFYWALLRYISAVVGRNSHNMATHYNIEDAIQESALEIWQRLPQFDSKRSKLRTWVNLITLHNIRDIMRSFRVSRGNPAHFQRGPKAPEGQPEPSLEATNRIVRLEEDTIPDPSLPADELIELKELMAQFSPEDRTIVQMLLDGLNQYEIAQALNLNQSTVFRKIKRIRALNAPLRT